MIVDRASRAFHQVRKVTFACVRESEKN